MSLFSEVRILALDIDGTLTDGTTTWMGESVGWTQRYSVRDGEAILRLTASNVPVIPVSRNRTACARVRMEHLGLSVATLGVPDKLVALRGLAEQLNIGLEHFCYVGDGLEDAVIFGAVGVGCAVFDAHPAALAAAHYVAKNRGGERAVEEVVEQIMNARVAT